MRLADAALPAPSAEVSAVLDESEVGVAGRLVE
jgi:hypothetical protein